MHRYVIRRLLLVIVTLFMVSIIVFLMIRLIPGDIVDGIISEMTMSGASGLPSIDREALERFFGVDVPIHVQYGRWIGVLPTPDPYTGESGYTGLVQGNLGNSLRTAVPVTKLILSRIGVTFELGLMAIVIGLLIALPVGVYSAMRQDTAADYVGRTIAIFGLATPNFWLATMILLYHLVGLVATFGAYSFQGGRQSGGVGRHLWGLFVSGRTLWVTWGSSSFPA